MPENAFDALNKRIIEIMVRKNHSKSSFAKILGVSLPLITHITTGRNKPGIELIQKVLTVFDDISPDWLLLGVGDMERTVVQMPDFTDIQAEINQLKALLNEQAGELNTIKQYHKILMDELLHLQEADILIAGTFEKLQNIAQKLSQIQNAINDKLTL